MYVLDVHGSENRYLRGTHALERTLVALVVPDVDASVEMYFEVKKHTLDIFAIYCKSVFGTVPVFSVSVWMLYRTYRSIRVKY